MVGLNELGEYAYDAEKLHNRLLEEERPVTAAVLRMIRVAQDTFREWVDALREKGRVTPDPKGLHEAIRAVEAELPGRESVIGPLPKSVPSAAAPSAPVLTIVPPLQRGAAASEPSNAPDGAERRSHAGSTAADAGAARVRRSSRARRRRVSCDRACDAESTSRASDSDTHARAAAVTATASTRSASLRSIIRRSSARRR